MTETFTVIAEPREVSGKGASRRLRREGLTPGIVYGGAKNRKPVSITVEHKELIKHLENEAFYSHVLDLQIGDKTESVILQDLQRHPAKELILHIDFERVTKTTIVHKKIPLHFINEESCVGVKQQGGKIQHSLTEAEITCKVGDLPEFIEVDMAEVEAGTVVHLSDLKLPKGVSLHHAENDQPICTVKAAAASAEDEEESAE